LELLGIDADRIHIVHSGLDETLFEPQMNATTDLPVGEPTFVSVGRLAANKGIDRILDAWALYTEKCPGRLLIIGDGPDRGRLEQRQVPNVEFLGRVDEDEKRQIIHEATALLHGAYREGWGMVITEAGALGTPSLAFDADGVRDAIRDGSTGRLVGSSEEMASVMIEMASNDESASTWKAMGGAAREWAATFTWARTADELLVAAVAAQGRK
jgi:glycosyltransferase involved in cell wall biosynthesis